MMLFIIISALVALSNARPNGVPKNVITVPPNCRPGQVWMNGQCRDLWRILPLEILSSGSANFGALSDDSAAEKNVAEVPPNCPPGQVLILGACRNVWRTSSSDIFDLKNVVTVPPNCPPGQEWFNGACRDIWSLRNVVTVPPNCPEGQAWINNACRDVWALSRELLAAESSNPQDPQKTNMDNSQTYNIISVPNQCAAGYRPDANGICRPIF